MPFLKKHTQLLIINCFYLGQPHFPYNVSQQVSPGLQWHLKTWSSRSVLNGRTLMTLAPMVPPPRRRGFSFWKHRDFKIYLPCSSLSWYSPGNKKKFISSINSNASTFCQLQDSFKFNLIKVHWLSPNQQWPFESLYLYLHNKYESSFWLLPQKNHLATAIRVEIKWHRKYFE